MFSTYHFLWLVICFSLEVGLLIALHKYRPSLRNVLSWACFGCVVSEVVKTLSVLEMVPSADGSTMHLYLEMGHLPLHLCSIQILFIFYSRFGENEKIKETLLAFMYPTCTVGALLATMIPTTLSSDPTVMEAFARPLTYQYFLFHAMLIVLGIYISMSSQVKIKPRHYVSTMGILGVLGFFSLYLNSAFAAPTYVNGEMISVDYSTNFFFTQKAPIEIPLIEKWHWILYLAVIVTIAMVVVGGFYLPYVIKAKKEKGA